MGGTELTQSIIDVEWGILDCPVSVVVAESPVLVVTDDKPCRIYGRHL